MGGIVKPDSRSDCIYCFVATYFDLIMWRPFFLPVKASFDFETVHKVGVTDVCRYKNTRGQTVISDEYESFQIYHLMKHCSFAVLVGIQIHSLA